MLLATGSAFAQGGPCYTAAQCSAFRQQAEQQAVRQAEQQREAQAAQQTAIAQQQRAAAVAHAAQIAQAQAAARQSALDLAAAEAAQRQAAQDRADAAASAQAQRDAAAAQARVDAENRAAAQLAAENSPDNHCKEQKIAGELMLNFNNIQTVQDYNIQSVDIEHLTTIKFEVVQGKNVYVCHGVFVLMNGRHVPGTLATRINVAGNIIVRFTTD
jgi:hypothetical protein